MNPQIAIIQFNHRHSGGAGNPVDDKGMFGGPDVFCYGSEHFSSLEVQLKAVCTLIGHPV